MSQTYGPYSSAREANGLIFIAGQVGVDKITKQAEQDFESQFKQVLANLNDVLSENNLAPSDIVNVRVYLVDMTLFEQMNTLYEKYFNGIAPSRECVGVSSLPSVAGKTSLLVELSAIAARQ